MEKVFSNSMKDNMSHLPPTKAKTKINTKAKTTQNKTRKEEGRGGNGGRRKNRRRKRGGKGEKELNIFPCPLKLA